MNRIKSFIEEAGWPRIIIGLFLLSMYVIAPAVGLDLSTSLSDTFVRFGMNVVLVLSLVPMIYSGTGLNFGLPLGVEAGLLGATISMAMGLQGKVGFAGALLISIPFSVLLGWGYAQILNKVKGGEMMIATYVGFSSVAVMCIMWLVLPFKSEDMIWAYGGEGLRTTISIEKYWQGVLNSGMPLSQGSFVVPVGEILFFAFLGVLSMGIFQNKSRDGYEGSGD